ncbi:hypothetical protein GOARA_070_00020 [Gordonia araii NBRC 100433]|uniref:Uncharacterized protein n=1 Tax=Gordonia araii NBRC 100433 TaxID=1073574 RepID=G7H6I8_9ACTN|nr:hypothetical protein GOARA_070_00020 [Gordonia araii NBRC 100433]
MQMVDENPPMILTWGSLRSDVSVRRCIKKAIGTWFSAVLRIDRSGAVDGQFDYDSEPEWDAPVDPIAYVADQEKYPRDVENQPDWLKAKLAEGLARRREREQ